MPWNDADEKQRDSSSRWRNRNLASLYRNQANYNDERLTIYIGTYLEWYFSSTKGMWKGRHKGVRKKNDASFTSSGNLSTKLELAGTLRSRVCQTNVRVDDTIDENIVDPRESFGFSLGGSRVGKYCNFFRDRLGDEEFCPIVGWTWSRVYFSLTH